MTALQWLGKQGWVERWVEVLKRCAVLREPLMWEWVEQRGWELVMWGGENLE